MDKITTRLEAAATASAPALLLRPWNPGDATALVELYRDKELRRWTSSAVDDEAGARKWVQVQQCGWEAGDRFSFAVTEPRSPGGDGPLVGHAVLKNVAPGLASAEVGYWTAAHARGRAVAPRALDALSDWAFSAFGDEGLTRLELLHQVDNPASCRVARKCRYELSGVLPPAPPTYPYDGHLHVRRRHIGGL